METNCIWVGVGLGVMEVYSCHVRRVIPSLSNARLECRALACVGLFKSIPVRLFVRIIRRECQIVTPIIPF